MSRSGKVSRTFDFLIIFGAAEQSQEKVEANGTGFSAEFFGSQSSRNVLFCQENKNSNVDNFLPEFDIANSQPFKILTT